MTRPRSASAPPHVFHDQDFCSSALTKPARVSISAVLGFCGSYLSAKRADNGGGIVEGSQFGVRAEPLAQAIPPPSSGFPFVRSIRPSPSLRSSGGLIYRCRGSGLSWGGSKYRVQSGASTAKAVAEPFHTHCLCVYYPSLGNVA